MKRIYLLMVIVMFLLFIKGVNSQQLGCCVETVDNFYCQVSDKDSGECNANSKWYGGKTNGLASCSSDVSECEVGCCVLDGIGYSNYYKSQCSDQKSDQDRFVVGNCPDGTDPDHKIGCILDTGECKWWTSEKCNIEKGSVDEKIINENDCDKKTGENEANKRCCNVDCSYKFAYDCNGEVGERGVPCGDIPEWCGDKCKWGDDECKNKEEKEIGAEVIKKDGCGGIKHLKYCSTEEYCFNGVCKNANCADKKHGDKWCIKSNYVPGSRDILKICEFGVINNRACDEFRSSVCKDNENEMAPGQEFDGAGCYKNDWENCFDYSGSNENDCKAKGDCEIIDGKCVPKYPPGFEFWLNDQGGHFESDKMCVSSYDNNKCVRSGDCEGGSGVAETVVERGIKEEIEKVEVFWISELNNCDATEIDNIWIDNFKSKSGDCGTHNYVATSDGCRVYMKACGSMIWGDACGNAIIKVNSIFDGTTIGNNYVKFNSYIRNGDNLAKDIIKDVDWALSGSENSYLCVDDGYWYVCDNNVVNKEITSKDEGYECVEEDRNDGEGGTFKFYMWKKIG